MLWRCVHKCGFVDTFEVCWDGDHGLLGGRQRPMDVSCSSRHVWRIGFCPLVAVLSPSGPLLGLLLIGMAATPRLEFGPPPLDTSHEVANSDALRMTFRFKRSQMPQNSIFLLNPHKPIPDNLKNNSEAYRCLFVDVLMYPYPYLQFYPCF